MTPADSLAITQNQPSDGPFSLSDGAAYARWRSAKLDGYPVSAAALTVRVADVATPTAAEREALMAALRKTNMVLYETSADTPRESVRAFGRHFGLERLDSNLGADDDGLTAIRVVPQGSRARYIPYTDKPISWHTDGYYNTPDSWIRGMILHCVRASASGGENALMDPDIAYILLRDANPAFIVALTHGQAMTIPPNEDANGEVRPEQTGPVFSLNPDASLHMRYTARSRNIRWRDEATAAVAALSEILASDSPYIFRHRMKPGQGLLSNNVLHNRTAFADGDDDGRLIYRGRYFDRIEGTTPTDLLGDTV